MKKYWSSFLFAVAIGFASASSAHAGIATTDFTESWRQASMGDAAALDRLTQAARQGDATAQRGLGFLYEQGLGVAKDIPQAEGWFRKAAEQDDVSAQVMMGWTCWFDPEARRDYDRAKFWLLKAAEHGSVTAQNMLGTLYLSSAADFEQARLWLGKAADAGHPEAMSNLAELYLYGRGGPTDYERGRLLLLKAVDNGYSMAMYNLGVLYFKGQGVPKDYVQSIKWFTLAMSRGDADAEAVLARLAHVATAAQLAQGQALAREWLAQQPDRPAEHDAPDIELAYHYSFKMR